MAKTTYTVKVRDVKTIDFDTPLGAFDTLCDKITEAENTGYKLTEISGSQYLLQKDNESRIIDIEISKEY